MKILIADDHVLVRDGLKLVLQQLVPDGAVVFIEAHDYPSLRGQIVAHPALDLAVVDLQMPGGQRGASLEAIGRSFPELPLVVVSAFTSPDVVQKVLLMPHVYAFVSKGASHQSLLKAVNACLQRRKVGEISDVPHQAPGLTRDDEALAPRLVAVRDLLRIGKSNKQIAYELDLSEGTVKNYMSEIFRRLKVVNRTQAARLDENSPL